MSLLAQVKAAVDLAFAQAADLVGEFWLTRQVQGAYNVTTGDSAVTEVEYMFEGVLDTSENSGGFAGNAQGSTGSEIGENETRVYLKPSAQEVTPEIGDVLRVGETKLRVARVLPVKPNGVDVVLWELVCTL